MKNLLLLLIAMMATSCASMSYAPRIEKLGEYDAGGTKKIEEKAIKMKWAEAEQVKVFIGKAPAGIQISESGELNSINKQHQVIGKVYVNSSGPANWLYFNKYPEDEDWRNGYCGVQTVLNWATLTLWLVTPFPWTCFTSEDNSPEDVSARKERIIKTLKKVVKAAGGDTLIITSLGKTQTVNANTNQVLHTLDMTSAQGYAVKMH